MSLPHSRLRDPAERAAGYPRRPPTGAVAARTGGLAGAAAIWGTMWTVTTTALAPEKVTPGGATQLTVRVMSPVAPDTSTGAVPMVLIWASRSGRAGDDDGVRVDFDAVHPVRRGRGAGDVGADEDVLLGRGAHHADGDVGARRRQGEVGDFPALRVEGNEVIVVVNGADGAGVHARDQADDGGDVVGVAGDRDHARRDAGRQKTIARQRWGRGRRRQRPGGASAGPAG